MLNCVENIKQNLMFWGSVVLTPLALYAVPTPVTVVFHDSSLVNDTVIYLADIADVSSVDNALSNRISKIGIGPAAPPGHSRYIMADDIIYRLKLRDESIDFKSNKKSRIKVQTMAVGTRVSDLRNQILTQLQSAIDWPPHSWYLHIDNENDTFKLLDAPSTCAIQGLKNRFPRGGISLQLVINQYGKFYRIPLACRFLVNTQVLVAQKTISPGQPILPSDCMAIKKDITRMGPEPCFSLDDIANAMASRTIPAGTIITRHLLRKIPDVQKGDNLSITIARGNVKISIAAVARENGCRGEKIWVQNSASNKLVRVVVTDKKSAELL